ncbi:MULTISPECIES: nuclear transport factor 2 family protein [Niastella]|uniref:Nuclear transport factor 2 family protein n=1 Tax=Niastella soli TaxID=2821487 RepID=A0ABS3YLX4_9BACT|nr:nuclear transport factor 2 family protein [Niastella soli]MBO9198888.1 nuclear transport factor 2 family protein [Niastella soli]
METQYADLIQQAYSAFNARNIDQVLSAMHPQVRWANGWEGGYVNGHEEVRDYWTRQWKELDPRVEPTGFKQRPDGRLEVEVHQIVKDVQGALLFDGTVRHIYSFSDGLITRMDIEKV